MYLMVRVLLKICSIFQLIWGCNFECLLFWARKILYKIYLKFFYNIWLYKGWILWYLFLVSLIGNFVLIIWILISLEIINAGNTGNININIARRWLVILINLRLTIWKFLFLFLSFEFFTHFLKLKLKCLII